MSYRKQLEKILAGLEANPKDVLLLQKAGELCQKHGDTPGAANYFTRLAAAYADDGFMLKAVALAKQTLKLAPGLALAHERLAQWHELLGLNSEAIREHQWLLEHYRVIQSADGVIRSLEALARLGGAAAATPGGSA
jgi:hypothetical protein